VNSEIKEMVASNRQSRHIVVELKRDDTSAAARRKCLLDPLRVELSDQVIAEDVGGVVKSERHVKRVAVRNDSEKNDEAAAEDDVS
jgi:protein tyrosine phosphatase